MDEDFLTIDDVEAGIGGADDSTSEDVLDVAVARRTVGDTVEVGSTPDGTGIITALTIGGTPVCLSRSVLTPRVV